MLFTSPIFLYAFLPGLLVVYLLTPHMLKNAVLAVASLFFYFWGEVEFVWVFLLSVVINYIFGYLLGCFPAGKRRTALLIAACGLNLLLLGFFKYANFFVNNINNVLGVMDLPLLQLDPVHLPIGISFITFHAMSYLIDINRGVSPSQRNPLNVLLYLSLFPQLIAGPIIRYHIISDQITQRILSIDKLYFGLRRFIFGLAKKVLIANQLGFVADKIFAIPGQDMTTPLAWLGILSYTFQLYFDFSGYSCMAIGLAMMFGFNFPENFNYPYVSRSIQEFWRRWHISLSSWFREYLYIPLGGNQKGVVRTYFNLVLVFFLCGLWHGASWSFVVWGLFHGCFLVIERMGLIVMLNRLWAPMAHLYALLVVVVAWVFFRSDNLTYAIDFICAMFGFGSNTYIGDNAGYYLTNDFLVIAVIAIVLSFPVWPWINGVIMRITNSRGYVMPLCVQILDGLWVIILGGICLMYVTASTYNPFIYFRF